MILGSRGQGRCAATRWSEEVLRETPSADFEEAIAEEVQERGVDRRLRDRDTPLVMISAGRCARRILAYL